MNLFNKFIFNALFSELLRRLLQEPEIHFEKVQLLRIGKWRQ